jgi:hypothetical protein
MPEPSSTMVLDAESSLHLFRYRPETIDIGAVYHYVKSNLDGTKPVRVSLRVASETHIDVLKVYPKLPIMFLVTADMDWSIFSAQQMHSYRVMPNGRVIETLTATLSVPTRAYRWVRGADRFPEARIGYYPFHEYNFDFSSFNFAFRHLIEPTSTFEIGVTCPDLSRVPGTDVHTIDYGRLAPRYSGKALVEYLGEERVGGAECRKYRMGGPGMENRDGYFWVNMQQACFQLFEHPLHDNPGWDSFRLALSATARMTDSEWSDHIDGSRRGQLRYWPAMVVQSLAARLRRRTHATR